MQYTSFDPVIKILVAIIILLVLLSFFAGKFGLKKQSNKLLINILKWCLAPLIEIPKMIFRGMVNLAKFAYNHWAGRPNNGGDQGI